MDAGYEEALRRIAKAKEERATELDLGGLGLEELPEEILELKDFLISLHITFNSVGLNGASSISQLKGLTQLDISYNKIGEKGASYISKLNSLTQLNINGNNIGDKGAASISQLTGLTELDIVGNDIGVKGTESISKLETLTQLDISINDIGVKGAVFISKLNRLSHLNIIGSNIGDQGAASISQLTGLTKLDVSYNDIGERGAVYISKLIALKVLNIRSNGVGDKGAASISQLKGLTELIFQNNGIGDQGAVSISQLSGLTKLDIVRNEISIKGLEVLYSKFKNKNVFSMDFDPIPGVSAKNWETLKQYFASIEKKEDNVKISALNVLLLGNTTAGKSAWLEYYLRNKFDRNSESTFGIVHESTKKILGQNEIHLSFWDFGGQEYFHGTHRLFMGAKNALYLVLWQQQYEGLIGNKNEKGDDCFPFRYWLGAIRHFSSYFNSDRQLDNETSLNSSKDIYQRTLLVQSKSDMKGNEQEIVPQMYTDKKGRFGLPVANLHTISVKSAFDNDAYQKLHWDLFQLHFEKLIEKYSADYPFNKHIMRIRENELPKWQKSIKRLHISEEEFLKKCEAVYQDANQYQDLILAYLENSGEILRFPSIEALRNEIFLNPKKLLNEIYELFSEAVRDRGGRFMISDIKKGNLKQKEVLIAILQYMELIFEDPQKPGEYIAPQYMKKDHMSGMLHHLRSLLKPSFSLRFPDFLPRASITQFISRYGSKSVDGVFWKFGVLYKHNKGNRELKVLVEADPNGSFIQVYAEDKSGKYEAMKEVFDFFAFYDKNQAEEALSERQEMEEELEMRVHKPERDPPEWLELSADGINYASIGEIKKAIAAKAAKVRSTNEGYISVEPVFHVLLNSKAPMPKKIFFSYAHADKQYRDEFELHFASLKMEGLVESWYDGMIKPGQEWDTAIKDNLKNADIVLYMLSPDFMDSKYIWENEINRMEDNKGDDVFIPVFLVPCDFEYSVIGKKQGVPQDEKDNISWIALDEHRPKRDANYLKILKKLREVIR